MPRDEHKSGARGGHPSALTRYVLLVASIGTVAVAGYVGYLLYPRFDLPAAEGGALMGLAAAAGIASFFSPCSFPLLLGLLGRQAAAQAGEARTVGRPLVFGGVLAAGAAAFMLLLGAGLGAGGEALLSGTTFASPSGIALRAVVGVMLVWLGLVQLGLLPSPLGVVDRVRAPLIRRQAQLRRESPVAAAALLGFGYVLAGFG